MRYSGLQVVFQEIPNEISLAIHVVGCPLRCPGCHSSDLWPANKGTELDEQNFAQLIAKHKKYISCVLFMGGEWHSQELLSLIHNAKLHGLKTALYSGYELSQIPKELLNELDYIKYGRYIAERGGLSSIITNQNLINLKTNENLNHYFTEGVRK